MGKTKINILYPDANFHLLKWTINYYFLHLTLQGSIGTQTNNEDLDGNELIEMNEISKADYGETVPQWSSHSPAVKVNFILYLKAVDTISNCQRLAFTVGYLNICIQ